MTFGQTYHKLSEIQADLLNRKITCAELVEGYLKNIEASKHLNAYVEVYTEEAREMATRLDDKLKDQPESAGRLAGMVIAIKDVLCYKDHKVTAASAILEGFESLFSCTAIERLIEEDAIIIGRVNCDQFAMGSTNENSVYGPVLNAFDETKVPGGSSGGSAVAVQTDTCLAALGTDTGGSVRQPAAFCGIIGFKPSYGRISRHGLLAYASSFDQVGILAKSVEDTALLMEIMAGQDEHDSTVSLRPVEPYSQKLEFGEKARIAFFDSALNHEGLDPDIRQKTKNLIQDLKDQGHTVEPVGFEYLDYIIPAYYVLTTAEASSNLSRYDGIKFGRRSPNASNLEETYKKSRTEGFSEEVKRRIILGTFVLSAGYYDAYYTKAQKVRRLIYDRTNAIFEDYDFILMPAAPSTPFGIGEKTTDPVEMYLADIYTVQANMAGIPAICLPMGDHKNGLPIGIQFMARQFDESRLLAFSRMVLNHTLKPKN
ncbi:MAG: Asp-tRNA(Asn)/Glu-tRNA(Gln) amidotransferase subunit GatA [Bacteroidota bacterium]